MRKQNLHPLNKLHITSSSMIYKFTRRFILMIVLPTLIAWLSYLLVLNVYFINNTLAAQENYLKSSLSQLELSLSNVTPIFSSLESTPEFVNYLDVYESKREMLYSLVKYLRDFCEGLNTSNASIESIRIYSDKENLLYSYPFVRLAGIPLDPDEQNRLEHVGYNQIIWHFSADGQDGNVPGLYAYKKLYANNYTYVIGYMEIKMQSRILSDYLEQFAATDAFRYTSLGLYHNGQLIYMLGQAGTLPDENTLSVLQTKNTVVRLPSNRFYNAVFLREPGLQVVLSGRVTDLTANPANLPVIMISVIIAFILYLFLNFFRSIADLSRQILDFSSWIRHSTPDHLPEFIVSPGAYHEDYEELRELIRSYNLLFQENSTLMSKVRKMELLSKETQFQALQAQIHPHFIYGTLENIRMLALQNRDKTVSDMIYSLSFLIRHTLSISDKAVKLEDELDIAKHYMNIQQVRFGERLRFTCTADDALRDFKIPSFVMQPILENSIMYGISNTFDACELKVEVIRKAAAVRIRIANSGQLIDSNRLTELNELLSGKREAGQFAGNGNGLALYNIKERLRIFYNNRASIQMSVNNPFTVTTIEIEEGV